jgi:O-antigen/teichoic acid export membrane protein
VLFSLMLLGSNYITYAGLYLNKRSRTIMIIMIASVVVKVIANVALIPKFGATGAAYATLIACAASAGATMIASFPLINFRVNFPNLGYYSLGAAVILVAMYTIDTGDMPLNLGLKLVVGLAITVPTVLLKEKALRQELGRRAFRRPT